MHMARPLRCEKLVIKFSSEIAMVGIDRMHTTTKPKALLKIQPAWMSICLQVPQPTRLVLVVAAEEVAQRGSHIQDWDSRLNELKRYQASKGNCNVPQVEEGGLGSWLHTQRRSYKQGVLWAERQTQLQAIPGMQLDLAAAAWDEKFDQLKAYKASNKHCNVPKRGEGGLGTWLSSQKCYYGKGSMTPERQMRLKKLEKLGVRFQ
jgi:hypothetical protein